MRSAKVVATEEEGNLKFPIPSRQVIQSSKSSVGLFLNGQRAQTSPVMKSKGIRPRTSSPLSGHKHAFDNSTYSTVSNSGNISNKLRSHQGEYLNEIEEDSYRIESIIDQKISDTRAKSELMIRHRLSPLHNKRISSVRNNNGENDMTKNHIYNDVIEMGWKRVAEGLRIRLEEIHQKNFQESFHKHESEQLRIEIGNLQHQLENLPTYQQKIVDLELFVSSLETRISELQVVNNSCNIQLEAAIVMSRKVSNELESNITKRKEEMSEFEVIKHKLNEQVDELRMNNSEQRVQLQAVKATQANNVRLMQGIEQLNDDLVGLNERNRVMSALLEESEKKTIEYQFALQLANSKLDAQTRELAHKLELCKHESDSQVMKYLQEIGESHEKVLDFELQVRDMRQMNEDLRMHIKVMLY